MARPAVRDFFASGTVAGHRKPARLVPGPELKRQSTLKSDSAQEMSFLGDKRVVEIRGGSPGPGRSVINFDDRKNYAGSLTTQTKLSTYGLIVFKPGVHPFVAGFHPFQRVLIYQYRLRVAATCSGSCSLAQCVSRTTAAVSRVWSVNVFCGQCALLVPARQSPIPGATEFV